MRTPERQVVEDEDDLFDITTPEKKVRITLPDVSSFPAAFKVVRLKVKEFEKNITSGVNLIVAQDVQSDSRQTFILLSGSWLMTVPEVDTEVSIPNQRESEASRAYTILAVIFYSRRCFLCRCSFSRRSAITWVK